MVVPQRHTSAIVEALEKFEGINVRKVRWGVVCVMEAGYVCRHGWKHVDQTRVNPVLSKLAPQRLLVGSEHGAVECTMLLAHRGIATHYHSQLEVRVTELLKCGQRRRGGEGKSKGVCCFHPPRNHPALLA